jgi:putative Mn2+ efflux pump MntP
LVFSFDISQLAAVKVIKIIMDIFTILFIAVGLSMDAFAVSITCGFTNTVISKATQTVIPTCSESF